MKTPLKSTQFDDVYFSAEDGLAETQHVFLDGNDLPHRWRGKDRFVVCETGFGTGLNFLSAWKLFDKSAEIGQNIHFISIEKYPLEPDFIAESLAHWSEFFEGRIEALALKYPRQRRGVHHLSLSDSVTLTLIFEDISDAIPAIEAMNISIDCWFLDGFKPSSNPDMWSEDIFAFMARVSNTGASFATFTAAGIVRRGLAAAGFEVSKVKGFGRKREMCIGQLKPIKNQERCT